MIIDPTPHNEHSTAFMEYGKQLPLKVVQELAQQANFRVPDRG